MHWRKVDPVQVVDGLLLTGAKAPEQLARAMATKSVLLRALPTAIGDDWAAIFARPLLGEDQAALPRLKGAAPLYQVQPGWWFPLGTELAAPSTIQADLLKQFATELGFVPPVILVPRFESGGMSRDVNVYKVHLRSGTAPE